MSGQHGELEAKSLAAELAFQLGGATALNALGPTNSAAASPDEQTVESWFSSEPALILLDELVLYLDKLTEQEIGNLIGFLRTLMTTIATRKQTILVITDPKDQPRWPPPSPTPANSARAGSLRPGWS